MNVSNQYWAGFFDGEGCVLLENYFSKTQQEKFPVGVKVIVAQKETAILYLLQKTFGGGVLINKQGIGKWYCGKASQVIEFLSAIKPYAIVKAVEISIALDLLSSIIKPRETNFDSVKGKKMLAGKPSITIEEIKHRQNLENLFKLDRADPKTVVPNES